MVAPDHWTDGGNNKSDIIGEQQLNTPEPSICGFDFDGSLAGLDQSENPRSAISKNHINNSSSITMMNGKESNTSVSMHGSKGEQPFEIRLDSTTSPTSFLPTADFNTSWQFERCPEDIVFSPEMSYHMSPLQSRGPHLDTGYHLRENRYSATLLFEGPSGRRVEHFRKDSTSSRFEWYRV